MNTPHKLLPILILSLAALGACASGGADAAVGGDDDGDAAPAAPTSVPASSPGEEVSFGGASFTLPDGWSVTLPEGDGTWLELDTATGESVEHGYRTMCVGPDGAECGLRLYHGDAPGHEGFQGWEDGGAWPWHGSTDVGICPVAEPGDVLDIVRPVGGSYLPADTGSRPVGDLSAVYSRWDVVCETSGHEFSPRSWHLPDADLVVIDEVGQAETESVLASFQFA